MRIIIVVFLTALSVSLISCDASVDAFLETDRYFTLFGTLDMAQDTQFVRVIPIRMTLDDTSKGPLDVTFTSEDLTTGIERTWNDSLVRFATGDVAHIFYEPMRMKPSHTYRIEVAKGDSVARAETKVPTRPTADVREPNLFGGVTSRAQGSQSINWRELSREPFEIELWYRFLSVSGGDDPAAGSRFIDILVPGSPSVEPFAGGWNITIDLGENRSAIDTLTNPNLFPLVGVGMRITVLDEEFEPPGGVFDRDLQTQPGTLSNVINGFGFVGSVGRFSVEWTFTNDTAERLRYLTLDEIFGKREAMQIRRRLNLSESPLFE